MNRKLLLLPVAAVVLAGGWFAYGLFFSEAPAAVSTSAALEQFQAETSSGEQGSVPGSVAPAEGGAVGDVWTVDDDFGEFNFESASGSFAGFRVEKSYTTGREGTAVGRSGGVTGELTIADEQLTSARIVVDMTQIRSNDFGREAAINNAVMATSYLTSTFELTAPVALDTAALTAGETLAVEVTGDLTIAGVTKTVTIPLEATIVEEGFGLVIGSTNIVWLDYGVIAPQASFADVALEGILEFQLVVRIA